MTATTHEDLHSPQLQQESGPQQRTTSPWMWIALIVAMFAAALLWLRHANPEDVAPAPVGERMLPAPNRRRWPTQAPAARQAAPASDPRQPAPAVRNREARPLAGNIKPTYPRRTAQWRPGQRDRQPECRYPRPGHPCSDRFAHRRAQP